MEAIVETFPEPAANSRFRYERRSLSPWRVIRYQVTRNAKIFLYFKVHAGLQLLQVLGQLLIFLYLGQLITAGSPNALGGASYASFLVIGMVLLQILDKSLIGPFTSLSGAYWSSRLESLMLSPHSLWLIISSDTVWYHLMTLVNAGVILGVGLWFGASFSLPTNVGLFLTVVTLGAVSVFGLGLMSASTFSLLNAKGRDEPISWAIHLLQGLACGLYFPFSMLPVWLQGLGLLMPHTYAIDSARRLVVDGYTSEATLPVHNLVGLDPNIVNCLCLLAATALYLPLGIYLFQKGIRKSREVGTLSRWT